MPLVVVLGAILLNLALVGLALARYPSIFAAERIPWVVADLILLLSYAGLVRAVAKKMTAARPRLYRRRPIRT